MPTRITTAIVLAIADDPNTVQALQVPRGARYLAAVLAEHDGVTLCFEAMDDVATETRRFQLVPATCQPLRASAQYLGTVSTPTIVHVYEVREDPDHKLDVRPFVGDQAWAECSCGWKSSLQHTGAAAEAAWEDHRDTVAG